MEEPKAKTSGCWAHQLIDGREIPLLP
jgi:hypothetical protein